MKECFIAIYIDKGCVNDFHNHILNSIKLSYRISNNIVIDKSGVPHTIPEKPVLGDLKINEILPYSYTFTS